jgi:hypothetical protein
MARSWALQSRTYIVLTTNQASRMVMGGLNDSENSKWWHYGVPVVAAFCTLKELVYKHCLSGDCKSPLLIGLVQSSAGN